MRCIRVCGYGCAPYVCARASLLLFLVHIMFIDTFCVHVLWDNEVPTFIANPAGQAFSDRAGAPTHDWLCLSTLEPVQETLPTRSGAFPTYTQGTPKTYYLRFSAVVTIRPIWTPILYRPQNHIIVIIFGFFKCCLVPWTPVFPTPLQRRQMPSCRK